MPKADESERSGCRADPAATKPVPSVVVMISCKNTSMAELAQDLQRMANAYIDHPIVDATGLDGGWDFVMGWTPKGMLRSAPPPEANPTSAVADAPVPDTITAFEAMERELGLKLVKRKHAISVIVVDHINEKPKSELVNRRD